MCEFRHLYFGFILGHSKNENYCIQGHYIAATVWIHSFIPYYQAVRKALNCADVCAKLGMTCFGPRIKSTEMLDQHCRAPSIEKYHMTTPSVPSSGNDGIAP